MTRPLLQLQRDADRTLHPALGLLRKLVSIRSTTRFEHGCALFLAQRLAEAGWMVLLQPVPQTAPAEEPSPPRSNLYAYRPDEHVEVGTVEILNASSSYRTRVKVLFNSHIDTVPPHIPLTEDDEVLRGRGTCDAKASVCAQIAAVEELLRDGKLNPQDVGLLYVVGEETDHIGMKVANDLHLSTDYLVVGEPTELKIAKGHKGMIKADIVVEGVAGHSGYPERGKSAIEALVEILHELQHAKWPTDDRLGATTLNLGTISGGVAANVIPAHAKAEVSFRVSTSTSEVLTQVRKIVGSERNGCAVSLNVWGTMDPVSCVTVNVDGVETFVARYFTDIPYLKGGHKSLLFGPGTILVAHAENEFVSKRDVLRAVDILKDITSKLVQDEYEA